MTKRVLAFLMVIAMVLSLVPTIAVAAATPGYTLTLQKAHNQTDKQLAVDVYLTAVTADQGDVTGYGFEVTPAEGLNIISVTDFTGNDGIAGSSETFVYSPTLAEPIAVGTTRVPVATIILGGETIPADFASALTLSNISVSTAAGYYQDTVVESEDYKGAVTVATAACEHEHEAGLTWTPITAEALFNADGVATGNYYLVGDVSGESIIKPAAENAKINLCLNGYTVTSTDRMFDMTKDGAELYISDCTATGTGEALKAGKLIPQVYNYNLRCSNPNTKIDTRNIIIEGVAEPTGAGNAVAFYTGQNAVNAVVYAENVLIKNVNAAKTVVDNRAGMHLKDVTFVNCTGGANTNSDGEVTSDLAIIAINGAPASEGERYLIIEDCKFVDCDDKLLTTRGYETMPITLKGNVQATGAAYITSDCNLTLDLDDGASVVIETAEDKTADTFGEAVTITDTLPKNVLTYANLNGALVNYADGKFTFGEVHVHEDKYAGIKGSQEWKPWTNPNALPTENGNYYLTTDVTVDTPASPGTISICLNGHTIDSSKAERFCQLYGYQRTFCDCQGYADPAKAGTIIGGTTNEGSVFHMRGRTTNGAGKLYLYDIKLTGNGTNTSSTAIYCGASTTTSTKSKGKLIMERVEVCDNEAAYGGALRLQHTAEKDNAIDITIDDCVFHDNTSRNGGGAMYLRVYDGVDSENTSITIKNSTFYNNSVENVGGAIYSNNLKHLTIENCEFTENQSSDNAGGAITMDTTTAQITDSTFHKNTGKTGGAIYALSASNLTITGSTFTDNVATDGVGGAIGLSATTAQITDSTFHNNTAEGAGAISAAGGSNLTVSGSTFTDNTATATVAGAIRSVNATTVVTISDSTFTGNVCEKSGGGAIYTANAGNTLKLTDCVITGNTDKAGGGGVYITAADSVVILSGKTIIAGNTSTGANEFCGDLYFQSNDGKDTPTYWTTPLIQLNQLAADAQVNAYCDSPTLIADLTAAKIVTVAEGGSQADWQDCGRLNFSDGTNVQNVYCADGVFNFGHFHYNETTKSYDQLTPWTSTTTLPSANPADAAGYYLEKDVTLTKTSTLAKDATLCLCMNGRTVKNSTKRAFSVPSTATGVSLTIMDCSASYDKNGYLISGGSFEGFSYGGNGAVFTIYNGTVNLSGIAFTNNTDTAYVAKVSSIGFGGGVIQTRNSNDVLLNIDGCKFANNYSESDGGAIVSQTGHITISNTVFEGNVAHRQGGAIMTAGTSSRKPILELTNCKFVGNHTYSSPTAADATTTSADTGRGGAICALGTETTITDCEFIDNTAGCEEGLTTATNVGRGGAIFALKNSQAGATLSLTGTSFEGNNVESDGGAIYIDTVDTQMTDCTFTSNVADNYGGAMCVAGATVTLDNCTATKNEGEQGGVARLSNAATLNINGGTYSENAATTTSGNTGGGVVRTASTGDTVNVGTYTASTEGAEPQGTTFTKNHSGRSGGVFLMPGGTQLTMDGATLTENTARTNAAITMWGAVTASLNNTTITNNHAEFGGYGNIAVGSSATTIASVTVSGMTVIDDNTYGADKVEENVVLRDNCTARIIIGEDGLTEGARIGVSAMPGRLNMDVYYITTDVGETDPSQYFFSDDANYSVAKVNGKLPVYTATDTAKPTTHEAGIAAAAAVAEAEAKVESGEYYQIMTATSAEIAAEGENAATKYTYLTGYVADGETAVDHLAFVAAKVGDDYYNTVQDAVEDIQGTDTVLELQGNVSEALTVTDNITVNLNGNTVEKMTVAKDKVVTIVDPKANDYDSSDAGKIKIEGEGTYAPYVEDTSSGSLKRYAIIENGDGTVTAHRIYVAINTAVLRTTNGGIGYKIIFAGDEAVQAKIASGDFTYGVQFSVGDNTPKSVTFAGNDFKAGVTTSTPNQRLAVIENIVEKDNAENGTRAEINIKGQPFITIGGETAWGTAQTFNLKTLADALLDSTAVSDADKDLVRAFEAAYGLN